MSKERWLAEIEIRCEEFCRKNSSLSRTTIEERDRLIRFTDRVIREKKVPRNQAMSLIEKIDQHVLVA